MPSIEQIEFLLESVTELTEAQLEYLVENRIEFIKNANKDKLTVDHDPESAKLSSDKVVDHIASKIDPTDRKEHTQWLVNRYKAGDFKLGDHKEIKKTMNSFLDAKPHLESGDLGQFKSVSHLKDAVATQRTRMDLVADKAKEASSEKSDVKTGAVEMPEVFRSGDNVGYHVHSKTASVKNYGPAGKLAKSTWCTAAAGRNNMFSGYAGGKYTLHLDNGHVMQVSHGGNQLMDVQNRPVSISDPRFKDHADVISDFVKKTSEVDGRPESDVVKRYSKATPADIEENLSAHEAAFKAHQDDGTDHWDLRDRSRRATDVLANSLGGAALTDDQYQRIKSAKCLPRFGHTAMDIGEELQTEYTKSQFAKPEHLDDIADAHISNNYDEYRGKFPIGVMANPNVSGQTQHKLIGAALASGNNDWLNSIATRSKNLTTDHTDRIKHLPGMKERLLTNEDAKLSPDVFEGASHSVATASHPDIPAHVAKAILEDQSYNRGQWNTNPADSVIANPAVPKHIIKDAIDAGHMQTGMHNVHNLLARDDYDSQEDVDHLVKSIQEGKISPRGGQWTQSTKLSRDNVKSMINHPNALHYVGHRNSSITGNPRFRPDDFKTVIDHPAAVGKITDNLFNAMQTAHELPAKIIDHAISKFGDNRSMIDVLTDPNHEATLKPNHLQHILDSEHANPATKHWVLRNPGVQMSHFEKMKDNIRNHGAISGSKNAPPSILHSLATSPMDHVRANVANNPNTEKRTLEILKADSNPDIAKIAAKKAK